MLIVILRKQLLTYGRYVSERSGVTVNLRALDQGEVRTREHGLGLGKGIDFACACGLACLKVCKQPVAVSVHVSKILVSCHGLLGGGSLLLLVLQEPGAKVSF